MLRTLFALFMATLSSFTLAQTLDETDPKRIARLDYGGSIEVKPKGNGKAELILSNLSHSQGKRRPVGSLYCLAKVGKGWPGNKDNDRFDIAKMPCGVVKDLATIIIYQWTDFKPGLVETVGYVPITVHADGRLYAWEQKPLPKYPSTSSGFRSSVTGMDETVVALHLLSTDKVIFANPEETALLKD